METAVYLMVCGMICILICIAIDISKIEKYIYEISKRR